MDRLVSRKMGLPDIENLLVGSLKPISPRPEFIAQLKDRLLIQAKSRADVGRLNPIYYILLIIATTINLLIFIAISLWTTISAISLIRLIRYLKRYLQQKRLLSQGRLL
jgi:hypothetical protein